MAKKTLGVAMIGCGSIATHRHAPEAAAHPQVKLLTLCDPVLARAKALADTFGGTPCADWRAAVAQPAVDAVVVACPNYLHAPVTIAALQAGKHVLCEKPMATSAAEATAMMAAAKASGKTLMIAHNQRLAPLHIRAKQLLKSGILGRIVTFRTSFAHPGPEGWSVEGVGGWFFQKEKAFVGAMGDLGVHKADLVRWLLDDEVVEVAAFVEAIAGKRQSDVDDNAICLLRMASGAVGSLTAGWSHNPGCDNSTVVYGEKGILRIDTDPVYTVIVELADGERQLIKTKAMQTNDEGGQTDSGIMATFVESVNTGKCPIPGEEGAKSLAVILACLESAETKRFVSVGSVLAGV
ncbi:MAG TPA: Gfo/Idh/MocA family oxidoreductase [Armatimonadota bacterium]|nr:Gfo/Idh/MocA family oxidoreductase [Armatimonadota bacterium]